MLELKQVEMSEKEKIDDDVALRPFDYSKARQQLKQFVGVYLVSQLSEWPWP
jgi:hypothetical protein